MADEGSRTSGAPIATFATQRTPFAPVTGAASLLWVIGFFAIVGTVLGCFPETFCASLVGGLALAFTVLMVARRQLLRSVPPPVVVTETHVVRGPVRLARATLKLNVAPWFQNARRGTLLVLDDGVRRLKLLAVGHRGAVRERSEPRADRVHAAFASPWMLDRLLSVLQLGVTDSKEPGTAVESKTVYRTATSRAMPPSITRFLAYAGPAKVSGWRTAALLSLSGSGPAFARHLDTTVLMIGVPALVALAAAIERTGRMLFDSPQVPDVVELRMRGNEAWLVKDGVVRGHLSDARACVVSSTSRRALTIEFQDLRATFVALGPRAEGRGDGEYALTSEDFDVLRETLHEMKEPPRTRVAEPRVESSEARVAVGLVGEREDAGAETDAEHQEQDLDATAEDEPVVDDRQAADRREATE